MIRGDPSYKTVLTCLSNSNLKGLYCEGVKFLKRHGVKASCQFIVSQNKYHNTTTALSQTPALNALQFFSVS